MLRRAFLIVVVLVLGAGCGTTGGGGAVASGGDKGSTTSTTVGDEAPGTEATEPDDGPIATVDKEDLERVLPEVTDLPEGFKEMPVPPPDTANTEYEPTIGCEAMAEMLGRRREEETLVERSFNNDYDVQVNLGISTASEEIKQLFADIGDQLEGCEQIRATNDEGWAADAFMAPGPLDLGDHGYIVDMHVVSDGAEFPPLGLTLIGVLHGDVIIGIQMADGRDEAENRVTRDPLVVRAIATQMAEDLALLLGD